MKEFGEKLGGEESQMMWNVEEEGQAYDHQCRVTVADKQLCFLRLLAISCSLAIQCLLESDGGVKID